MKKIFTLVITLCLLNSYSQSFYKGALVVDAAGGIEIFNTTSTYTDKSSGKSESDVDRAGNSNFNFGAEYGLHKRFGAGIRFKTDNYFVEKDTVNNNTGTVKGMEILAQLNYHPVSTKNFDLLIGADFGYSMLRYNFNDADNTRFSGNGLYYSLYLNPRLYFGRFGINMKLGAPFLNYGDIRSNDPDFNKEFSLKMKGSPGFQLGFGIQYRFLNSTDGSGT